MEVTWATQGNLFLDREFRVGSTGSVIHSRGSRTAPVVSNPFHVHCLIRHLGSKTTGRTLRGPAVALRNPADELTERRRRTHRPRADSPQAANDCTGISQATPACLLTIPSGRMPSGIAARAWRCFPAWRSLDARAGTLEPAASFQGASTTPTRHRRSGAIGPRLDRHEPGSGVPSRPIGSVPRSTPPCGRRPGLNRRSRGVGSIRSRTPRRGHGRTWRCPVAPRP
jgi:hypothetical protein